MEPTPDSKPSEENWREVINEPFHYVLLVNESAFYYMVSYRLTPEDVAKYLRRGKLFLNALVNRVR